MRILFQVTFASLRLAERLTKGFNISISQKDKKPKLNDPLLP